MRGVSVSIQIPAPRTWPLRYVFLVILSITSCATPQGIKDASKNQLKLLDAMNTAAIGLQQGLDEFHSQQNGTIEDWARVQVATDAIEAATRSENGEVTPDSLFVTDRSRIRPLIFGVTRNFDSESQQLTDLQKKTETESTMAKDDGTRQPLQLEASGFALSKDRVTRENAEWATALNASGCGERCSNVHSQALQLLTDETKTAAQIHNDVEILQSQIATMSQIAQATDQWLSIDITLSQAQATQLNTTYKNATAALGKKK